MRREFADWALQMLDENPEFGQTIIFSDDAKWLRKQAKLPLLATTSQKYSRTNKCTHKD